MRWTAEKRKEMSLLKTGSKNPQWKGEAVGYTAIHEWVKNRLKKPERCENCREKKPLDLANRSGKYLRKLSDWEWLCRRCHMKSDGRLKKLVQMSRKVGSANGMYGRHHSKETKRIIGERQSAYQKRKKAALASIFPPDFTV